jgi:1-acyl-sn-glycerol-3-phosphate acyltransferase
MKPMASYRHGQSNPFYNGALYAIGQSASNVLFNTIWRRKAFGVENVPPAGTPVIFAANHRSLADPNLVGSLVPYPIYYFAKAELFDVPLVGWYIRRVNAFPVKRKENDVGAFKTAVRVLEQGGGLLLFPEGGRRLDPVRQWKAKAGVGTLACRTGAMIVPVGVLHSDRFTRLASVTVRFGQPIYPSKGEGPDPYQELSNRVMRRIKELCHEPT